MTPEERTITRVLRKLAKECRAPKVSVWHTFDGRGNPDATYVNGASTTIDRMTYGYRHEDVLGAFAELREAGIPLEALPNPRGGRLRPTPETFRRVEDWLCAFRADANPFDRDGGLRRIEAYRERKADYAACAEGACWRDAVPGRTRCERCADRAREASRAWRAARKARKADAQ